MINNLYNTTKLHPAWVVGFVDGEGTFFVELLKNKTMKLGIQVQLRFIITQHIRDAALMEDLKEFFGCGYILNDTVTKKQFRIAGLNDITTKLLPLFDLYPLHTQKALDLQAFREVHALMLEGLHLTPQGLEQIRSIKAVMNRARMAEYKITTDSV